MSWSRKEYPSPFDETPIEGLHFLDGDRLTQRSGYGWPKGHKYSVVEFPSGETYPIWFNQAGAIIHLFGELDLFYHDTPEKALHHAQQIARATGYAVEPGDDQSLIVRGQNPDEQLRISYDPQAGHIRDVQRISPKEVLHPAHQLMTDEIRALLPNLYTGEDLGTDSIAPVKYFTPDSYWTWYASEFDGDDLMFGLVVGNVIELGFFSLLDLQQLHSPLHLPIERDLHYQARSLQELIEHHQKLRGER